MKIEVGKNIKKERMQRNWSQQDLAQKLNVSRQTISKWELGNSYPDIENLVLLSQSLHVSVDSLVGLEAPVKKRANLFALFSFKRSSKAMSETKWFSGGKERKEEALVLISTLVSELNDTNERPLKEAFVSFYEEIMEEKQSIPFIFSHMNVTLSKVMIENEITLSEENAAKIKQLSGLSAIRYGY